MTHRRKIWMLGVYATIILALAALPAHSDFSNYIYTEGHGDITVSYSGTGTEFTHVYNFEGATVNGSDLDEVVIESRFVTTVVPEFSALDRPAGAQWDPTGAAAGGKVFLLPASDTGGVPFLGWSTELISSADFPDGIRFELESVSGPGAFSAWRFDGTGNLNFVMSSATSDPNANEGITFNNVGPGNHTHFNLGFSSAGIYDVNLRVTGIGTNVSSVGTYRFNVVPEPSGMALVGLGVAGLVFARSFHRRKIVEVAQA